MDEAKTIAARTWFGYGRWDAPYWFIGMEPGGDDTHTSYEAWNKLGATELIDCRAHHLWKRDVLGVEDKKWTRWHDGKRPATQPTWRRLIQLLLAYKQLPTDLDTVRAYQSNEWGSATGETAVLELGALHARSLSSNVDRESHRYERIAKLQSRLIESKPVFAVCYGYGFTGQFERVIGAAFDASGFFWCGDTLCVLAPGPTSRPPSPGAKPQWWIDKGEQIRAIAHGVF